MATIREKVLLRRLSTPQLIILGFLALMVLGTVLLKLPVSTERGISWVDAMFVSVSAGSVTGLSTVDFPATFTAFGDVVVVVLVQLGGLGIMTVTTMAALLVGQRVGFRDLLVVRESIESVDSPRNILRLLLQIARITLFWRELPRALVARALAVLAVASLLVLLSTLALMVSDGLDLLPALFEVTSAFGTVGLSLDVTTGLSTFGKVLIAVVMFLGRVGPITFVVSLAARQRTAAYRYPREDIAIG